MSDVAGGVVAHLAGATPGQHAVLDLAKRQEARADHDLALPVAIDAAGGVVVDLDLEAVDAGADRDAVLGEALRHAEERRGLRRLGGAVEVDALGVWGER